MNTKSIVMIIASCVIILLWLFFISTWNDEDEYWVLPNLEQQRQTTAETAKNIRENLDTIQKDLTEIKTIIEENKENESENTEEIVENKELTEEEALEKAYLNDDLTVEEIWDRYNIDVSDMNKIYWDSIIYYEPKDNDKEMYVFWTHQKIYPKEPEDLPYTNAMNLEIKWFVNDFTQNYFNYNAHDVDKISRILNEFYDETWRKVIVIVLPSKEWNTFDDLYYNALALNKDQNIDDILFIIKENWDFWYRYKTKLDERVNDDLVNKMLWSEDWYKKWKSSDWVVKWIENMINILKNAISN